MPMSDEIIMKKIGICLIVLIIYPVISNAYNGCSIRDIEIKSFKVSIIDKCEVTPCLFLNFVGELVNHCKYPVGVEIQITARDIQGNVVDVHESWPAGIKNIQSQKSYPFSIPGGVMDYQKSMKDFSIEVIDVKQW